MISDLISAIKRKITTDIPAPVAVILIRGTPDTLKRPNLIPRLNIIAEQLRLGGVSDIGWCLIGSEEKFKLAVNNISFLMPKQVIGFVKNRSAVFIGEDQYHVANEWVADLLERANKTNKIYYPEGYKDDPPNQIAHQRLRGMFVVVPSILVSVVAKIMADGDLHAWNPELTFKELDLPHQLVEVGPGNMGTIYRQCVLLDRPINFIVELNSTCNYVCLMCPYHGGRQKRSPYYLGPKKATEMPIERFKKIIDEIAALDRPYEDENINIRITPYRRGEILFHPDWREALAYVKDKGFELYFSTNGSLWLDDDIQYVVDIGVDLIQVSLNGYGTETHKRLRLNNEYEKVAYVAKKMVQTRIEKGLEKPKVQASNLLNEHTVNEIPAYLDYWLPRVDQIYLSPESYSDENGNKVYKTEFSEFELPDPSSRPTCSMIKDYFVIDADGQSTLCMGAKKVSVGNYDEMSVQELLDSPMRQGIINSHVDGDYDNPTCKNCGHWLSQTFYHKEDNPGFTLFRGPTCVTYTSKNEPVVDPSGEQENFDNEDFEV